MPDKRTARFNTGPEEPRHGLCAACGDEWVERDDITICPECHSLDVIDVTLPSPDPGKEPR